MDLQASAIKMYRDCEFGVFFSSSNQLIFITWACSLFQEAYNICYIIGFKRSNNPANIMRLCDKQDIYYYFGPPHTCLQSLLFTNHPCLLFVCLLEVLHTDEDITQTTNRSPTNPNPKLYLNYMFLTTLCLTGGLIHIVGI